MEKIKAILFDLNGVLLSGFTPNFELLQIVKELKTLGYKTAIISNTSAFLLQRSIKQNLGIDIDDLFDMVVNTTQMDLSKLDRKIYESTANNLGVKPAESIYVDNIDDYVKAAKETGMKGIIFTNNTQLKDELNNIGVSTV